MNNPDPSVINTSDFDFYVAPDGYAIYAIEKGNSDDYNETVACYTFRLDPHETNRAGWSHIARRWLNKCDRII